MTDQCIDVPDADGYTEGEIGAFTIVPDFLPPPDQLIRRAPTTKVTIDLTTPSVSFFKARARAEGVPYSQMIRAVLDAYAAQHGERKV
jgi:hypothetical protein